jgi:hypothetical protein
MAFSEWCNEHRKIVGAVTVVCVVAAIGSIVWQLMGQRHTLMTKMPDAFFSVDDGRTFFVAGGDNYPPFDYQGQTALRAYVFQCGSTRFVGYLERFTPAAHQAMVDNKATSGTLIYGRELKKPGAKTWVSSGNQKASAMVADVHCPDGSSNDPVPIEP